jgi:hypothetical protein
MLDTLMDATSDVRCFGQYSPLIVLISNSFLSAARYDGTFSGEKPDGSCAVKTGSSDGFSPDYKVRKNSVHLIVVMMVHFVFLLPGLHASVLRGPGSLMGARSRVDLLGMEGP